jgi:hypothetical protein
MLKDLAKTINIIVKLFKKSSNLKILHNLAG